MSCQLARAGIIPTVERKSTRNSNDYANDEKCTRTTTATADRPALHRSHARSHSHPTLQHHEHRVPPTLFPPGCRRSTTESNRQRESMILELPRPSFGDKETALPRLMEICSISRTASRWGQGAAPKVVGLIFVIAYGINSTIQMSERACYSVERGPQLSDTFRYCPTAKTTTARKDPTAPAPIAKTIQKRSSARVGPDVPPTRSMPCCCSTRLGLDGVTM